MKKYKVLKSDELDKVKIEAVSLMKKSGFLLTEQIEIGIDEKLQFMGFTTQAKNGNPLIVVSKMAIDSGNVLGLIIHEMGHIYRTEANHPSHNFTLLDKEINRILHAHNLLTYADESMHNIINCIEDIYADDISFSVFRKFPLQTFRLENMSQFFLSWINMPLIGDSLKTRWKNAEFVVNAAFAKANLVRHDIKDEKEIVERAIENFLVHIHPQSAKEYEFFETFMVQLPENISQEDFVKLLRQYIEHFLLMTT